MNAVEVPLAFVTRTRKATRRRLALPPTRSAQFIIYHLDKSSLSPRYVSSSTARPLLLLGRGSHGKKQRMERRFQGYFSSPDLCLISVFALLCPELLLIMRRWNTGEKKKGLLIKKYTFIQQAEPSTEGNSGKIADIMRIITDVFAAIFSRILVADEIIVTAKHPSLRCAIVRHHRAHF